MKTEKQKKSNWIGIINVIIGVWTILSCYLTKYYGNVGSGYYYPSFLVGLIYIILGLILKNNRFAIIALAGLHLIQVININNDYIEYFFSFGPHLKLDLLHQYLYFSVGNDWASLRFGGFIGDLNPPFCQLNISSLILAVLLFLELKKLNSSYSEPWEAEFNEDV